MAISAKFLKTGQLEVLGDHIDNSITVQRNAAGTILVNGGAVSVQNGTATVANTHLIEVFGQAGDDTIALDETNGVLPAANLFGGAGNDTITGGSGADKLFGESGNDTLLGKGGDDRLFGGAGNDTLTGGAGSDQMFGGAGNDRLIWNPGDGSDLAEGGAGNDTLEVNLGNGSETFTIAANDARVLLDRVTPGPFSIDAGTIENIVINANGGDDVITAGNGLSAISLTIDGGAGNDTITGGDGNDRLIGGDGNDLIVGGRGSDTALLGAGNDVFVWNPGDGSDVVDGQADFDTLDFRGANVDENVSISANGTHALFARDPVGITMDLTGIERIQFEALGGADRIVVNDLTGTDVKEVAIDLASSGTGDGVADNVTVNATAGNDVISLTNSDVARIFVNGLTAQVTIDGADPALDTLVVNGLGGNDTIDASALSANWIKLAINGGAGNDTIIGSQGNDTLIGGAGDDVIIGGRGADTATLGDGNDTFVWNQGDGSDVVDGQAGTDTLVFNSSNLDENVAISANGERAVLTRDLGVITMDTNGVETIEFNALAGKDSVTINDMTGTSVSEVDIDLAATLGGSTGDGQDDTVVINGTSGNDVITLSIENGALVINGLASKIVVEHFDPNDTIHIAGLGGDDVIDASAIGVGGPKLVFDGGAGNDTLIAGDDILIGGPGDNVIIQSAVQQSVLDAALIDRNFHVV